MAEITKPNFNNALWASGGSIVSPSDVKIATGWTAEVPPFQWENWSQNRQDQGIAYILQHGIPVWDSLTEYQAEKSIIQGSDGLIYKAKTTNTGVNPVLDTLFVDWTIFARGGLINTQVFSTAGTFVYTPTPGTLFIIADVQAGGGQGGGSPTGSAGNITFGTGGASGSHAKVKLSLSGITSISVTVGIGGSQGTAGQAGQAGGASSLGPYVSCAGGAGGTVGGPTSTIGFYGNSNPLPTFTVNSPAIALQTGSGNSGLATIILSSSVAAAGSGSSSQGYGGSLGQTTQTGAGVNGNALGGGGGGALTIGAGAAQVGGLGVRGQIVIYEFS